MKKENFNFDDLCNGSLGVSIFDYLDEAFEGKKPKETKPKDTERYDCLNYVCNDCVHNEVCSYKKDMDGYIRNEDGNPSDFLKVKFGCKKFLKK